MRLKKTLLAVLAAGMLLGSAMPAEAYRSNIGRRQFDFAGHGDALTTLSLEADDPGNGTAWIMGAFQIVDMGASNIDKVYIQELIVQLERNGTTRNAQALGGHTNGDPANLRTAPLWINSIGPSPFGVWRFTLKTGCLHKIVEPGGVLDGDDAWVRATYRIFWQDGTNTTLLVHKSQPSFFNAPTDCQ